MYTNGHLERNSFQCGMTLIFARQVTKEMIEKTETYATLQSLGAEADLNKK